MQWVFFFFIIIIIIIIILRNYIVCPLSLLCVCNWSLKFQVSVIGSLCFQNERYKSFC